MGLSHCCPTQNLTAQHGPRCLAQFYTFLGGLLGLRDGASIPALNALAGIAGKDTDALAVQTINAQLLMSLTVSARPHAVFRALHHALAGFIFCAPLQQ